MGKPELLNGIQCLKSSYVLEPQQVYAFASLVGGLGGFLCTRMGR
jgi:hypothetical protein